MELIIIIVLAVSLAVLVGVFIWGRFRERRVVEEQGDNLSRVVGEKVEASLKVFGDVRERLGELTQKARDIEEVGKSISSLQEALRAPKFRGEFGELGLEVLLMNTLPPKFYSLQHRFRNGEAVDAVVRVGENLVPIDSKFPFPLEDFERMVTTSSQEEQARLRKQFTRIIKKHVDDVSKYIQPDEKTFDFALMYIPAENVYYETVVRSFRPDGESDIYSHCLKRRVFPVSPNSFYAYLQAIVLGLKGLQVEKSAREILGRLEGLKAGLQDFQKDYTILGGHIRDAATKHARAEERLAKLSGGLEQLTGDATIEKLPEGDVETHEQDRLS